MKSELNVPAGAYSLLRYLKMECDISREYRVKAGTFARAFRAYCQRWDYPSLTPQELREQMVLNGLTQTRTSTELVYTGVRLHT